MQFTVVAALPDCVTFGRTAEEALAMAESAARLRLDDVDLEALGATEAALTATIDFAVPSDMFSLSPALR
jgi:predicted RNase H-like HicB family nuclease